MPVADFTGFAKRNTLILLVSEYEDGHETGAVVEWCVPPLSAETEFAVRKFQTEGLRLLDQAEQAEVEQAEEEGQEPPKVVFRQLADYWAPIIAVCVQDPVLDEAQLKQHYPGQLLRSIGQSILQSFLFGTLPEGVEQESPLMTPPVNPPPMNRAQRRAKKQ